MKKIMNGKVIGWVRKVLPFYLFTLTCQRLYQLHCGQGCLEEW